MKKWMFLLTSFIATMAHSQNFQTDNFISPNGKEISITFFTHASLKISYNNKHYYIDPVSNYSGVSVPYENLPKADYILITHHHGDHLDVQAIQTLQKQTTVLVANEQSSKQLGQGIVMKNNQEKILEKGITLQAVPAYNTTADRQMYHPKNRDNGYVLHLEGFKIYIAGDTEDIPEMKNQKGVDVAFLPVNQPYTMTLNQAENAARMINPKVLYPYHFNNTPIQELQKRLKDTSIEVRIRKMN